MSNFQHPATKQFFDNISEKVVGKFKGETDGMLICEYVGLRPKMYSLTDVRMYVIGRLCGDRGGRPASGSGR